MTELLRIDPEKVAIAHARWYRAQPVTHCRRCDREFPNMDNGKTEYCSWECEIGWFKPKPPKRKYKVPTHKRNLGYSAIYRPWGR